jgi:hypothetical protein
MEKALSSLNRCKRQATEVGCTSPSPSASADLPHLSRHPLVGCAFGCISLEPEVEGDPAACGEILRSAALESVRVLRLGQGSVDRDT